MVAFKASKPIISHFNLSFRKVSLPYVFDNGVCNQTVGHSYEMSLECSDSCASETDLLDGAEMVADFYKLVNLRPVRKNCYRTEEVGY